MQRKAVKKIDVKPNLKLYYAAIGIIVLGYIFLAIGDADSFTSLTLGPIILVFGYLVAVPFALLRGIARKKESNGQKTGD